MGLIVAPLTDINGSWIVAPLTTPDAPKKITIGAGNPVVDIYGQTVTHTYDYWFITTNNIDMANFNGTAITVVDSGTNLQVVNGLTEISLYNALVGQTYRLVAFDADESNYFRFSGTVVEET